MSCITELCDILPAQVTSLAVIGAVLLGAAILLAEFVKKLQLVGK